MSITLRQVADAVELQFMGHRDWLESIQRNTRVKRSAEELTIAHLRLDQLREAVRLFAILLRHPEDVRAIIEKDRAQGGF